MKGESGLEYAMDAIYGVFFLGITAVSSCRMLRSLRSDGVETVITIFYFIIFFTAAIRTIWFFIPSSALESHYAPNQDVIAFETEGWWKLMIALALRSAGTVALFSIFILIVIYWADVLRKVFHDSMRGSRPMGMFCIVVSGLGKNSMSYSVFPN